MNIDISIDKVNYNGKRFLFLRLRFTKIKTGLEKGKATFSKSGYIIGEVETVRIADEADYAEDAD